MAKPAYRCLQCGKPFESEADARQHVFMSGHEVERHEPPRAPMPEHPPPDTLEQDLFLLEGLLEQLVKVSNRVPGHLGAAPGPLRARLAWQVGTTAGHALLSLEQVRVFRQEMRGNGLPVATELGGALESLAALHDEVRRVTDRVCALVIEKQEVADEA